MRMFYKTLMVLFVSMGFISAAHARERVQVIPVDEGLQEESLVQYRLKMLDVIADRDVAGLAELCAENVMLGFGAEGNVSDVPIYFADDYPEIWEELKWAITHGGHFTTDEHLGFSAPYPSRGDLEQIGTEGWDAFTTALVIVNKANFREEPNADSSVIDLLSFEYVEILDEDWNLDSVTFVKVKDWRDRTGYIHKEFLRHALSASASFARDDEGNWKMVWFGGGD